MDETVVEIIIREFDQDLDQAYIYASWRNSSFYSSEKKIKDDPKDHFHKQNIKIKDILQTAKIRIACFADAQNVIVGYAVYRDTHLDWIFVKPDYRLKGIGSILMPRNIKTVTNELTKIGKCIVDKKNLITKGEENGNDRDDNKDRQTLKGIQSPKVRDDLH